MFAPRYFAPRYFAARYFPELGAAQPGFVRHYTGVLTPRGAKTVDHYARIAAPAAPVLSQIAGGALGAATYFAKVTLVSPSGETTPSAEASLAVDTGWTEPVTGLVSGASPPSENTTGWDVFNVFVPDPVPSARYTTDAIDTGFDDDLRVTSAIVTGLGPGEAGTPALAFSIDTWLTGESDPESFVPWTIGFVNMRHIRGRIDYDPIVAGAVSYIAHLVLTIDTSPRLESGGSFDVAAGGSVLAFPTAFHFPPFMPAPNVL